MGAGDVSDGPQEALILIPRADSRLSSGVVSPSPSLTQITCVVSAFCARLCRREVAPARREKKGLFPTFLFIVAVN